MDIIKFIKTSVILLVSLLPSGIAEAQQSCDSLKNANERMYKKVAICGRPQVDSFMTERNDLMEDTSQIILNKGETVQVGLLAKNKTSRDKSKGDYSTYWANSDSTTDRYNWVFVVDDFINRCITKNVTLSDPKELSERLCKMLGLETENPRDTLVCIKILSDSLFRPSYNTDITKRTTRADAGSNSQINCLSVKERKWFRTRQLDNSYPWTRMGYTYDWGDMSDNYVGVTEFIVKPFTPIKGKEYITMDSLINKIKERKREVRK